MCVYVIYYVCICISICICSDGHDHDRILDRDRRSYENDRVK